MIPEEELLNINKLPFYSFSITTLMVNIIELYNFTIPKTIL